MNMPVQITIIGLGQLGASAGMALGQHQTLLHRVGHDKRFETAREAQKMGAVDDITRNLPASVREAKIVLLSLPANEIRPTLEVIAPDLTEGAVVMDTAPVKGPIPEWAQELLPEGRYYVGLVPAINPVYLHRIDLGVEAATADLFQNGLMMLSPLPGVPEEAVQMAANFIHMLGAKPFFADRLETDGLMTKTHIVPQLAAAALLNAMVDQPGWNDARKLAGRPFAALTSALAYQDEFQALGEAVLLNSENVTRVLDMLIGSLQGLRDDISTGDQDQVLNRLELALEGRNRWLAERTRGDWVEGETPDLSKLPSFWERMMGSRKRSETK
jgi:prephenate dehydrogenase